MTDKLPADYHMHTFLCGHAEGMPEDYVLSAEKNGVPEICFTDHAPSPDGYDPINRMTMDRFPAYRDLITKAQSVTPNVRVLWGIEADYYPTCREFLKEWLPEQKFDVVLGSVHYITNWGFDNPSNMSVWDTVDITETWKRYFDLLCQMAQTRFFDVVSHMDLTKRFGHKPAEDEITAMVIPALDAIAESEMAIEINTSGLRRPVHEMYPSLSILKLARERNIPICFGSDSHEPQHVGYCFDQAVQLAKSAGYTQCVRFRERQMEFTDLS